MATTQLTPITPGYGAEVGTVFLCRTDDDLTTIEAAGWADQFVDKNISVSNRAIADGDAIDVQFAQDCIRFVVNHNVGSDVYSVVQSLMGDTTPIT